MTTKTFLVDFKSTRTLTYNQNKYKIELVYDTDEKLSNDELEELIKEGISDKIEDFDCDNDNETININDFKEVPTLDQMKLTECLKCEVFNNVCQKCTYYVNNKCDGKKYASLN